MPCTKNYERAVTPSFKLCAINGSTAGVVIYEYIQFNPHFSSVWHTSAIVFDGTSTISLGFAGISPIC